jgi:hypothetical protein
VPVVECDDDGAFTGIAAALTAIRAEFTRRGGAMKRGDAGDWLTVVWDEVPLCIGKLGKPASELMIDLLSAGRPRKMRLIAGSTSDRVGALGIEGYGDLLESCAVLRLGSFASAPKDLRWLENVSYAATLELRRKIQPIDRSRVPALAQRPIDQARVWAWQGSQPAVAPADDDLTPTDPPKRVTCTADEVAAILCTQPGASQAAVERALFGFNGGAAYKSVAAVWGEALLLRELLTKESTTTAS